LARRILLADDSVTAQNMGRRILTDAGYEVLTVNNGSAALKKIAEHKPDLIVLDVYMPGYGGLEVCQRVKENPETRAIPVLLTVGKLEPFKAEEARRVGADAFIVKPFEATELLTVLTKLEDKIVAQPQPQKSGRFGKTLATEQPERFGDKETGWKNRLTIPNPNAKPRVEETPEPVAVTPRDPDAAKPVEPAQGFERPIPAGLPVDITPEEIAAITAAAASFGGKTAAPSIAEAAPVVDQKIVDQEVVDQAIDSQAIDHQAAVSQEETAQAAPVESHEAVATTEAVASAPEASSVQETAVEAASNASAIETENKTAQEAEVSRAESHQIEQPAVNVEAIAANAVTVDEAIADAVSTDAVSRETTSAETLSEPTPSADMAPVAASSETTVPSGAQISEAAPTSAGDDEVMAALASLAPMHGGGLDAVQHGSYGSNGSGHLNAASANGSAVVAEIYSGPRWIAELVELGPEESKLALDLEMEHAVAARASAEAASSLASNATLTDAVSAASVSAPEAVAAIFAEASVVGSPTDSQAAALQAHESQTVEATAVDAVAAETLAPETSADQENVAAAVAEGSAYAAAAAAGAGADHSSPAEFVSVTTAAPENNAAAQAAGSPQREAELAAAWQNWKQIRESFVSSQAPAAETEAETKSDREEVAASVQAAPVDAVAEQEEVEAAEVEAPESDAPEESTAIASIVDSMLAELRPKLVEEIAKKMNSEKKSKDKKKKK
jgi:CheY-like chemotaxis protein